MSNSGYREEAVKIAGLYELSGTLTVPNKAEERYPAVLLIAGSGKIDRDGNIAKPKMQPNIYRDLAEIISSVGFVTLRYDKRGVGASGGNYLATGVWDLVDDIKANIAYLKQHPQVDAQRIILLGHSEGCMLATAASIRSSVAGLVLLAGAAETLAEALQRQRAIAFTELKQAKGIKGFLMRWLKIDQRGEKQAQKFYQKVLETPKATIRYNLANINAKWFREHLTYNAVDDLRQVACPVLAVTGDKDFQANPEKVREVAELVQGEAEGHVVKNMNHLLKEQHSPMESLKFKQLYRETASQPIHPELNRILTNWFMKQFK